MSMFANLEEERETTRRQPIYKLRKALEFISLGKYSMKLYDEEGTGYYASWIGGVITLLAFILLAFMATSITLGTIHKQHTYV
jgi:hypothetical protein